MCRRPVRWAPACAGAPESRGPGELSVRHPGERRDPFDECLHPLPWGAGALIPSPTQDAGATVGRGRSRSAVVRAQLASASSSAIFRHFGRRSSIETEARYSSSTGSLAASARATWTAPLTQKPRVRLRCGWW